MERENVEGAGTELDTGNAEELEAGRRGVSSASTGSARGSEPPERKDGQRDRSSGREVPPDAEGAMCERMAAASRSCTCWCLLSTNLEASRQCGVCSHRCLMRHEGWRYIFEQLSHLWSTPRFFAPFPLVMGMGVAEALLLLAIEIDCGILLPSVRGNEASEVVVGAGARDRETPDKEVDICCG